jgi:cell division protein FtsI/penicillin-binding protein 2
MNSKISGVNGKYSYADGYRAEIPGSQSEIIPAQTGTSVRLTVDRDIQWVASKAIAKAVNSSNALSGTVIVMDPKTGHILAHATAPTFDPNNTKKVSLIAMRNPSVQDIYEPGSTGKIMTLAAAIEEIPHVVRCDIKAVQTCYRWKKHALHVMAILLVYFVAVYVLALSLGLGALLLSLTSAADLARSLHRRLHHSIPKEEGFV